MEIDQFPTAKNQGKFTMPSVFMQSNLNGKIFLKYNKKDKKRREKRKEKERTKRVI